MLFLARWARRLSWKESAEGTKMAQVVAMTQRKNGATISEIMRRWAGSSRPCVASSPAPSRRPATPSRVSSRKEASAHTGSMSAQDSDWAVGACGQRQDAVLTSLCRTHIIHDSVSPRVPVADASIEGTGHIRCPSLHFRRRVRGGYSSRVPPRF